MSSAASELEIHVARGRSGFRVSARSLAPGPELSLEVTFSGQEEGVWFRLLQAGVERVFSQMLVARHPPLSAIVRLIGDEVDSSKSANEALLSLLFRSLLVYVSRISQPVPLPRWGRPLRDRRIERAIELLNADLSKYWTVERLARAVGLSRPVFARQFVRMLRLSPMRYLAHRRLQVAAELMLCSDASLAQIAASVGYRSEFAFGRAFKRRHGVAPGTYRRGPQVAHRLVCRLAA